MTRTLTERAALAEIYGSLAAQLNGGDVSAKWYEGWLQDHPEQTQDDLDFLLRVAERVQKQLAKKAEAYQE